MPKSQTDYFWTDAGQAQERINHCVILYDDMPFFVESIDGGYDDGIPSAMITPCGASSSTKSQMSRKMLNSPKFRKFRDLPRIGWTNLVENAKYGAVFLCRINARTRVHGLSTNNVSVKYISAADGIDPSVQAAPINFGHVRLDRGFVDSHRGEFPSLDKVLANIQENSGIAFSTKFCVIRDYNGLRWLYRNTEKVGIFTGADTLNLISRHAYLREEIMEDKVFTINTIREF